MTKKIFKHNREAWDSQVRSGSQWTIPVSKEDVAVARGGEVKIVLTPTKLVPSDWLGNVAGKSVLCLCGGGGQQAPLLAAAGANVTTLDLSGLQLARDQEVAEREGLTIHVVQGLMSQLDCFRNRQFDLIVHPCSNCFTPDIETVWTGCYRILKSGGSLIAGFCTPYVFLFDPFKFEEGELVVRHSLPYADQDQLTRKELKALAEKSEPLMFGHTFSAQIGGQLRAGFQLVDMFEDSWSEDPLSKYLQPYLATRAMKVD
jgi:ubiquinone/menaquinone biosynthesis C-methylase UbiE